MGYATWNGVAHRIFVVHGPTKRIVKVVQDYMEGARFIDSFPKPERYDYYNASRYTLAKNGLFPKTKAGEVALQRAIAELSNVETHASSSAC